MYTHMLNLLPIMALCDFSERLTLHGCCCYKHEDINYQKLRVCVAELTMRLYITMVPPSLPVRITDVPATTVPPPAGLIDVAAALALSVVF